MIEIVIKGILIPFIGTTLGAATVFLLKNKIAEYIQKVLIGFAAGVMIAASIWSLIIPAIELSEGQGNKGWLAASIGFMLGILILMLAENQIDKIENIKTNKTSLSTWMMFLAVTLHNIPEGMAVGVTFAGLISGKVGITVAGAITLAIGIGIQNIPEGAIISMPLKSEGISKTKSFIYGMLSGIVEPIGSIITISLTNFILPVLSYLLAFAAGAMIYVVSSELIPQMQIGKYKNLATISLGIGFIVMMSLDVVLG